MRYLSVCSGIEAATVAWHPLGWTPVAFSEIEKFPSAVLAHHYPNTPNLGDMTQHEQWPIGSGSVDLLVGGTPCQSFSVAGLRKGLADPRGNLALTYLAIADRLRPRWLVWENVPGVLSSGHGRDFGAFLGALGKLGYGFAYRVLDAQYFGVAQRRRRVFVVGHASDWRRAAAVLFERESLRGHPAPSREAREITSTLTSPRTGGGGSYRLDAKDVDGGFIQPVETTRCDGGWMPNNPGVVSSVCTKWSKGTGGPSGSEHFNLVTHAVAFQQNTRNEVRLIGGDGQIAGALAAEAGMNNRNYIANPVPYDLFQITAPVNRQNRQPGDPCHTLARDNAAHAAVAFTRCDNGRDASVKVTPTMRCGSNYSAHLAVATAMAVRRLTPVECERLQGFPDGYTAIPWRGKSAAECPDGPRYRALGNSMAVPVMRWIGERIAAQEAQ